MKLLKELVSLTESPVEIMQAVFGALSGGRGWTPTLLAYAIVYALFKAGRSGFYFMLTRVLFRGIGRDQDRILDETKKVYEEIKDKLGPEDAMAFRGAMKELEHALSYMEKDAAWGAIRTMDAIGERLKRKRKTPSKSTFSEAASQPLGEKLHKSDTASDYIHDFVHSRNKQFKGKSKKKRINMALGAYYATHGR